MKQLKMNQKNKKVDFFSMLLGTLGTNLLGNLLRGKEAKKSNTPRLGIFRSGKEAIAISLGWVTTRVGEETIRTGQDF